MPRDKDLKRLIRTRMQKTGEAYTAARAQITKKPVTKQATTPQPDYAVLAGKSDAAIEAKTGRTWQQWVQLLDKHGAADLPHGEIARLVQTKYDVGGWWAQTVTVGYERIKGLRALGQRRDGSYEANKSKTFNAPVETLFDACSNARTRRKWLDEPIKVRSASALKAMRIEWNDGSIVVLGFTPKGEAKSVLSVQHTKLASEAARERFKQYWAKRLAALAELLEP